MRRRRRGILLWLALIAAGVGAAAYAVSAEPARHVWQAPAPQQHPPGNKTVKALRPTSHCDIKGNISRSTGERIYHLPGQEFHAATRISRLRGERWFCTEAEARAAGWRRARQ